MRPILVKILSTKEIKCREAYVHARCLYRDCKDVQSRVLSKVGKNWRFGGPKVKGDCFDGVSEGDFFVACFRREPRGSLAADWTLVTKAHDGELYAQVDNSYGNDLYDRMSAFQQSCKEAGLLYSILSPNATHNLDSISPVEVDVNKRRRFSVHERLKHPSIMQEMMKTALSLSANAQKNFLSMLELVAESLRSMLVSEGLIDSVEIDHLSLWSSVAGKAIAFVDGGMANIGSLGAETDRGASRKLCCHSWQVRR